MTRKHYNIHIQKKSTSLLHMSNNDRAIHGNYTGATLVDIKGNFFYYCYYYLQTYLHNI